MADARGFGLYVHWPFCRSKCPYCDFNSHVRERIDQGAWRSALLAELDHYAAKTGGRRLHSIFFGGGTPSLMEPATAGAIIDRAKEHWTAAGDIEITLEANPTSVEAERLADFRAAGITRISMGVQALDDDALAFLGREHGAAEALAAVDLAAGLFDRYSFDLIYARPNQTVAAWREELRQALDHANGHLSVYQLTVEPGTRFYDLARAGVFATPVEEVGAALYDETQRVLESAGMPAYEISNHASAGNECRHNSIYWRYGDYAGVGPGAHGRLTVSGTKVATRQHPSPDAWLRHVETDGHATRTEAPLSETARREEMAMMGLRLTAGIRNSDWREEFGRAIEDDFPPDRLSALIDGGFLTFDDDALRATQDGRARLDAVLGKLLG